jgi:hypothetical protein
LRAASDDLFVDFAEQSLVFSDALCPLVHCSRSTRRTDLPARRTSDTRKLEN